MKKIFIKDINANSNVCDYFLVKRKELCKAKNDKYYLAVKLCDRSGDIDARIWERAKEIDSIFGKGDIIKIIRGAPSVYQKRVQISIGELIKVKPSEVDMADYIESSELPVD